MLYAIRISKSRDEEIKKLPDEQRVEAIRNFTKHDYNKAVVEVYENNLKTYVPGYKPLTDAQKAERKKLHDLAEKLAPEAANMANRGLDNVDLDNIPRGFQTLFLGIGNSPEEIAKKNDLAQKLRSKDSNALHGIFTDLLNEFASYPLDEFDAMSPEQKLEALPKAMPTLLKGMESETLLNDFVNYGCKLSPEEKELFVQIRSEYNRVCFELMNSLEEWSNDYYPEIDFSQISAMDYEIQDEFDSEVSDGLQEIDESSTSAGELLSTTRFLHTTKSNDIVHFAREKFAERASSLSKNNVVRCTADGKLIHTDINAHLDLKKGDPLFFAYLEDGKVQDMTAVCDCGDGIPREMDIEAAKKYVEKVPEPNIFVRFFDKINRAFGGKGFESVNKYNDYIANHDAEKARIKEEAKNNRCIYDKFKDGIKSTKEYIAKHEENSKLKEITQQRANKVALTLMLNPEKMGLNEKKWMLENPDAVREALEMHKEGYKGTLLEPYSEMQLENIAEFDKQIEALDGLIAEKSGKVKDNDNLHVEKSEPLLGNNKQTEAPKKNQGLGALQ